ncbi:MAG: HAMP domain-containing histidine kinase [Chloroflexi bacterium]|nr:HAMP domain-containing histidine kinase [Chloroflexota bacterium]
MFSSLRSRLWLSYAFLIVTALVVVAIVLILYIASNPVLYRQTETRLRAAQEILAVQPALLTQTQPVDRLAVIAQAFNVRVLVFAKNGALLRDSSSSDAAISLPIAPIIPRVAPSIRDFSGKVWLYSLKHLPDGNWLMVAAARPKVAVLAVLTDELLVPLAEGGLIALLLSLILAYAIARWVADPLQQIIAVSRTMPADGVRAVSEGGPHEVRALTRSFNAMLARVASAQQSQRDFVANVSHELKTPLTSIQGFAQAILDGTAGTPEARQQAAQVIYNEAGRMHRMALDLLDLARLDSGTADLKVAPVNMTALLNGIAEKFSPMASKSGVNLNIDLANDLPILNGDGDRLAQVFTNLVDNALKFTPRGGTVSIRAVQDRGEAQVSVSDTGEGIPADAIPHIFDRFYQADSARSGGEKHGAGLGLAIVHDFVVAHGGRISVRSAPGRGTAFIVHLPLNRN